MITRRLTLAALVGPLAGCSSLILPGQGDPAQLYTLTPKSTFAGDLPLVAWQLVIEPPVAAAGLNTSRIALQRTPVSLDYYARANWTDSAPLMVQTLLIESFENTGKIVAVSRESVRLRPDYLLQTELRELQAEYFPDARQAPLVRARIIASSMTAYDSVAENSIDCRLLYGGRRRRRKRRSAMKPMSNMRSASSTIRTSESLSVKTLCLK